jgi:hypothetical protein
MPSTRCCQRQPMDEEPIDPARVAEAEAIIDRVAALRPVHDYETNGLTWAVAAFAVGLSDVIEETRADRDRLREEVTIWANQAEEWQQRAVAFGETLIELRAERDRLRASWIAPSPGWAE